MRKNILPILCLSFLLACKKENNVIKIPQGNLVVEEMWSKKEPDTLRNIMPYRFWVENDAKNDERYIAVADTVHYDLPPVYGGEIYEYSNNITKERQCNVRTKAYYMDVLSNPTTKRSVYNVNRYGFSSADVQYQFLYFFSTNLPFDTIVRSAFFDTRLIIDVFLDYDGEWGNLQNQGFDSSSIITKKTGSDLINIYGARWPENSELIFKKKIKNIFLLDTNKKYKDWTGIWAQPKLESIGVDKRRRRIELVYKRKTDQKEIRIVKEVQNTGLFCFPYNEDNEAENKKYQIFKEGHPDYWDYWNGKIDKNHPVYGKYWIEMTMNYYAPYIYGDTIVEI